MFKKLLRKLGILKPLTMKRAYSRKTLFGKKAFQACRREAREIAKQGEKIYRGAHGGGCCYPDHLATPSRWSKFWDFINPFEF